MEFGSAVLSGIAVLYSAADDAALARAYAALRQRFEQLAVGPEPGERDQWQDSFELRGGATPSDAVTLLARGATLPGDARLLVFDDITEVVSAQRSVAWAEVARRLAHEIKNPLTQSSSRPNACSTGSPPSSKAPTRPCSRAAWPRSWRRCSR